MENQNQNNSSGQDVSQVGLHIPPGYSGVGSVLDGTGGADLEINSLSSSPSTYAQVIDTAVVLPIHRNNFWKRLLRPAPVLLVALLLGVTGLIAGDLVRHTEQSKQPQSSISDKYSTQQIPLKNFVVTEQGIGFGTRNVVVNGPLTLNGGLVVSPSNQPATAAAGQLYYDQTSNVLSYYNGTRFVPLDDKDGAAPAVVESVGGVSGQLGVGGGVGVVGNQLVNTGVLSLGGQTGAVALGNGLVMLGNVLQNNGILSITPGSSSVSVADDGDGNVTIDMVGAGTGTVTGSGGTAGRVPLFTGSQNIEDSLITQGGTTIAVNGGLNVTGALSLSTALTVGNGGTGTTALAANGVIIGGGATPLSAVTSGAAGLCFLSTAGAPTFSACPSASGVTSLNGLTGAVSIANASGAGAVVTLNNASTAAKGIASFNPTNFSDNGAGVINTIQDINSGATPTFAGVNTNSITPSAALTVGISAQTALLQGSTTTITSSGAGNDIVLNSADTIELQDNTNVTGNVGLTGDLAVNGGDIAASGALNVTPGGALTLGSASQNATLQGNASLSLRSTNGANTTIVGFTSPTANTTLSFPALPAGTYTICTDSGNCAGVAATLQSAYSNSTNPEIVLDATRAAVTIRDNVSPLGTSLLEVQDNSGATTYLAVTSAGVVVTGTAAVSGNINSVGGGLQTNGSTRIDNSGNATNIGTLTLSGAISGGTAITGSGNINTTGGVLQTNSTTRVDNTGNLVNIVAVTASGSATFQGGSATLGTIGQAGSLVVSDGSSNTGTLQVAALGQNTVYTLPDSGSGAATICLTTGNCAGSGGGVTGSGTNDRLTKFTSTGSTVGDSTITDNGTIVTTSGDLVVQGGDATIGVASSQTGTLHFAHSGSAFLGSIVQGSLGNNQTYTLPDASGDFCLSTGNCLGGGGGGANTSLSNLTSVAINTALLPVAAGTINVGSGSLPFGEIFLAGTSGTPGTNNFKITGASTGGLRTITLPDASGTVCIDTNNCSYAPVTGSANYIQNQTVGNQTADFQISGNGRAATFNGTTGINTGATGGTQRIDASGNLVNIGTISASGNVTAGTYNSQTISSVANFTGTLTVQGASTTLGTTLQQGSLVFHDGNGQTATISVGSALLSNTVLAIPTAVGVSDTFCLLTLGNCTGGTVTTIGTLNSQTKSANGAVITGNDLVLQTADASFPGLVSTGTQTFAGAKTFSGAATFNSAVTVNANLQVTSAPGLGAAIVNIDMPSGGHDNSYGILATDARANSNHRPTIAVLSPDGSVSFGLNWKSGNTTGWFTSENSGGSTVAVGLSSGDAGGSGTTSGDVFVVSGDSLGSNVSSGNIVIDVGSKSGTGTAGTVAVGGTNATGLTLGHSGLTTINGGNLTVQGGTGTLGTTSQQGSLVLHDGNGQTATISVGSALGANTALAIPTTVGISDTFCLLTLGNCTGGAVSIMGTINSQTKSANGAVITSNSLILQTADASFPGLVSTGTQTFAGDKTFNGNVTLSANSDLTLQGATAYISNSQNSFANGEAFGAGADVGTTVSSTAVGNSAITTGNASVAVGYQAATTGDSVAIGANSSCINNGCVAVGKSAVSGFASVAVGHTASANANYATALNGSANFINSVAISGSTTAANQFVAGYDGGEITKVIFGSGVTDVTPTGFTLQGTSGSGTDIAGASVAIAGGQSTGNANGGSLNFQISAPGASGAGTNSLSTVATLSGANGSASFQNAINSATAFRIQDSATAELLTANTVTRTGGVAGNLIKIGNSTGTDTDTTVLQLDGASADPTTNLASLNGGLYYNSNTHKVSLIENGVIKIICNTVDLGCGTGTVTLQSAYGNGNTITATNARDISFALADTATDPNFLIDLQCDTSCSTNGRFAIQDDGVDTFTVAPSGGAVLLQNTVNSTTAFNIKTASPGNNNMFTVDTTNSQIGIALGGSNVPSLGAANGLQVRGALRLSDGNSSVLRTDYTTPLGSPGLGARFVIDSETLPSGVALMYAGLTSASDNNARGIAILDARNSGAHAPTIAVVSVDESKLFGLSWEGQSTDAYLKTTSSNMYLSAGGANVLGAATAAVSLLQDTTVAATKTLTVTSGLTSLTGNTTGDALSVSNSSSTGNIAVFKDNSTAVLTIANGGAATFQNQTDSTTGFQILSSAALSSIPQFVIDTSNSRTYIGNPTDDATGALLVLDHKNTSGDPTGVAGAMYYNTSQGQFRCYLVDYWRDCTESARTSYHRIYDMGSLSATQFDIDVSADYSGGALAGVNGVAGHPGILQLQTSASAAAWAYIGAPGGNEFLLGNTDSWRYEASLRLPSGSGLSSGTQRYTVRAGFTDDVSSDGVDGCFFKYSDNVNSGKWQGVCLSGGSPTTCDTGSTVALGTWYRLGVVVNPAGTSVDFRINGTSVCQVVATIPTGSGNVTGWGVSITKSIGTTNRTVDVDYEEIEGQFGTPR